MHHLIHPCCCIQTVVAACTDYHCTKSDSLHTYIALRGGSLGHRHGNTKALMMFNSLTMPIVISVKDIAVGSRLLVVGPADHNSTQFSRSSWTSWALHLGKKVDALYIPVVPTPREEFI